MFKWIIILIIISALANIFQLFWMLSQRSVLKETKHDLDLCDEEIADQNKKIEEKDDIIKDLKGQLKTYRKPNKNEY